MHTPDQVRAERIDRLARVTGAGQPGCELTAERWIRWFNAVGVGDVSLVGERNASHGEMIRALGGLGVRVPDGFAITAEGYRHFITVKHLAQPIAALLESMHEGDGRSLETTSRRIRELILRAPLPDDLVEEIRAHYWQLSDMLQQEDAGVAVCSSATAEDLPGGGVAGACFTFLQVPGEAELLDAVRKCFASLFTPRAIRYRENMGFAHARVALSVGIQAIARSDLRNSGANVALDTKSGLRQRLWSTGCIV